MATDSGGLAAPSFITDTGIITAAEVAQLHATPATIVPAPAVGIYIEFLSAHVWLDFLTTDYTTALGNFFFFRLAGQLISVTDPLSGNLFANSGADEHRSLPAKNGDIGDAVALEALILIAGWSGGDSPIRWSVDYRLRTFEF